jgi:CheY-like chemotaxis protein
MTDQNHKQILLLVEDSEDDAFLFEWTFNKSKSDLAIRRAVNGAEAVEILRAAPNPAALPRIIFLDLKMPVMNGFDVLAWMQTNGFLAQIPVIVISGSNQPKDLERAAQLGASQYLIKPVSEDDLQRIFEELLSRPHGPARSPIGVQP